MQPELANRLARLKGELARCQPDMLRSELCPHSNAGTDVTFGQELKRQKFEYMAAESELRLLQCQKPEFPHLDYSDERDFREKARLEAKKALRQLKQAVQQENKTKEELYSEIARLLQEHEKAHQRCEQNLKNAQELGAGFDDDMGAGPVLHAGMQLHDDNRFMGQGVQSLTGLSEAQSEEQSELRRQEFQAECLRKSLEDAQATRAELERVEQQARAKIVELEGHAALEEEFKLGLPKITFDDSAGTVTLGYPAAMPTPSEENVAVRTVLVRFDEQGKLVAAEPHHSLQLSAEAKHSVEQDDIARLLTLVWDRICQQSEGADVSSNSTAGS